MKLRRLSAFGALALFTALVADGLAAPQAAGQITFGEVGAWLKEKVDCERLDQIVLTRIAHHDFTGDGRDEAVVTASTCMTGTAGPDVHAVFTRTSTGALDVLRFDGDSSTNEAPESFTYELKEMPLFGNPNYLLAVEGNELVARWWDTSNRKNPVVIWFTWNGRRFVQTRFAIEGPFATSYDCRKATAEMDRAICYAPDVAALDIELGKAYQARLSRLPADQRKALQDEQRRWLIERAQACTIYKWWVDCLTERYQKRIPELQKGS